jgi:hypothetical protein
MCVVESDRELCLAVASAKMALGVDHRQLVSISMACNYKGRLI